MSHKTLNRQFAGRIAALLATSTLFITASAFAQTDPATESSLLARCNEQAANTYVSAFEVTADFDSGEQESRLFCTPQSNIANNGADVAELDITDDAGVAASKLVLGPVQVAQGYMLIVFTEADYTGSSRHYDGSLAATDEMRIGSYMVRLDPIVSACGGDRSVKVIFWDRENFTSSPNAQPQCFSRDQSNVGDVIDASFVKMGSVHVNRAYKLVAFRKNDFDGAARVLFSDNADTITDESAFKVKSYLLVPSVALESVEETDAGVVLSYSRVSTGSHSVVIPRAAFRVVESEDELSRTIQYATGREDEPWRDLATVKDGRDGEDGKDGAVGAAGPDGKDGEVGPRGAQGEAGSAGRDGEDGAAGGAGPQGEQGEQGEAGAAGRDGRDGVGQVATFDPLTSSCGDGNKGVMEYDHAGTSLLICDGTNWITLSFTQAGTRLGFPSVEELGSAASFGGAFHTCALLDGGNVECWGSNHFGQTNVPAGLAGRVRQIAAGTSHTCAVTADGNAECWGGRESKYYSNFGQTNVPAGLAGRVRQIAAGWLHTCAVTADGNAECWGWNRDGQTNVPAGLAGRVRQIMMGNYHTCALLDDGNAECWGSNGYGRTNVPTNLAGRVRQITAGWNYTCAVTADGNVECWGGNYHGQTRVPTGLAGRVRQIAAGSSHTCAVLDDGNVECWGGNYHGQTRVPAGLAGRVRQIAAGRDHTCAVTADGNAECWGYNYAGQTNVPADLAGRIRQL